MPYKQILGTISLLVVIVAYVPYYWAILKKQAKPHILTWITWVLITGIAFAVQVYEDAGPGSWLMGLSCALCLGVAILSIKYGEKTIKRSDWCSFSGALMGLPLWYITKDPTWSVILISLVDALGFYPTFRKSWQKPYDESPLFFFIGALSCVFSILALEKISIDTALYNFSVMFFNLVFVILLLCRRFYQKQVVVQV
jgi:hypothetical protein